MKRIVSLMLIALMLGAMAVSSVADVDPSYIQNGSATNNEGALFSEGTADDSLLFLEDTTWTPDASGGIQLEPDNSSNANGELEGSLLVPDKTYRYVVYYNGAVVNTDNYNIRVSAKKGGSTISSASIVKMSGEPNLVIEVKTSWPTTKTECEYEIRLSPRSTSVGTGTITKTFAFETGYEEADDSYINSLGQDDEVIVDPERPVYTKEQLEKIASVYNYRNVTFTSLDGDWRYTTNVSDMKAINMLYNYNGIADLLNRYPDHDFEFLSFPSGPVFSINGRIEVDVADLGENFDNYYVYRYLSGNLTELKSTYDADDETLTFNASTLGRFVISDQRMETTNVEEPDEDEDNDNIDNDNNNNNVVKPIPGTGAVA